MSERASVVVSATQQRESKLGLAVLARERANGWDEEEYELQVDQKPLNELISSAHILCTRTSLFVRNRQPIPLLYPVEINPKPSPRVAPRRLQVVLHALVPSRRRLHDEAVIFLALIAAGRAPRRRPAPSTKNSNAADAEQVVCSECRSYKNVVLCIKSQPAR